MHSLKIFFQHNKKVHPQDNSTLKNLKRWVCSSIYLVIAIGCNDVNHTTHSTEEPINVAHDSSLVYTGPSDSIPTISGSCLNGRTIGTLKQYPLKMKIGESSTDSIYVRSDAASFSHNFKGNVLGKIKSGTIVYAQGPLKNRAFSAGVAYAFPVKDKQGNICRGYISYLNIAFINH